jgi:hypothetical protein
VDYYWSQNMSQEKATRQVSNEDRFEPAMRELTEVARSLHELLLSYGPLWYTDETDARLCNALAEADSALTVSEKGSRRPRSLEFFSALPDLGLHSSRSPHHGCK